MKFEEKNCESCPYKNSCAEVYRKLGNSKTEPVAKKVILVFLLPLIVFIVALAISQGILTKNIESEDLAMVASFAIAATVMMFFVVIVKAIVRYTGKSL